MPLNPIILPMTPKSLSPILTSPWDQGSYVQLPPRMSISYLSLNMSRLSSTCPLHAYVSNLPNLLSPAFAFSVHDTSINPVAQANNLGVILEPSLYHTPHPIQHQVSLDPPLTYLKLDHSHHLHRQKPSPVHQHLRSQILHHNLFPASLFLSTIIWSLKPV